MTEEFDLDHIINDAKEAPLSDEKLRMAIRLLDLTSLNEDDSIERIEKLCADAHTPVGSVAAVCVYPRFVETAASCLGHSTIRVATVINFPNGDKEPRFIESETSDAINAGAQEIDVVFDYHSFLSEKPDITRKKLKACRKACPSGAKMKVILESGAFSSSQKLQEACLLAMEEGADFLKTSTGKIPAGASLADAAIILRAIRHFCIRTNWHHKVGFKVSGGVRTAQDAVSYQVLAEKIMGKDWLTPETFRIGASSLKDALLEALGLHAKPEEAEAANTGTDNY